MSKREFKIHNPNHGRELREAFQAKLLGNISQGIKAIQAGEVKPFTGHPIELEKSEYNFTLGISFDSQQRIFSRIITPLQEIAKNYDIEMIYPYDGDLPPHITVDAARFNGLSEEQRKHLWKALDENRYLDMVSRILENIDVRFDRLVITGNNIYICVGEFGPQVVPISKARRIIETVFRRTFQHEEKKGESMDQVNYMGILHINIGRIIKTPEDRQSLRNFAGDLYQQIGVSLRRDPLDISVISARHGPTYEFMKEQGGALAKE